MSIKVKFNLILILILGFGFIGTGFMSYNILQQNAKEEALKNAEIMMQAADAIRWYTVNEVKPLLDLQNKRQFIPQTVPAYSATSNFKRLQEKHPDYSYKEAVLNPTNPVHRATGWETDVIDVFRNHPNESQLSGVRSTVTGDQLYISHPIKISNAKCLVCHSTPSNAPQTMLALYGSANGFGWKLDEVVGAQIVSVPMEIPLTRAEMTFITFMSALLGIFVTITIVLNLMLHYMVIKPVVNLSKQAHDISMGRMDSPEFEVKGNNEIADLGRSFNRMRRSLDNAMTMISSDTSITNFKDK